MFNLSHCKSYVQQIITPIGECVLCFSPLIHQTTIQLNWLFPLSKLMYDVQEYFQGKMSTKRRTILMFIYIFLMQPIQSRPKKHLVISITVAMSELCTRGNYINIKVK